MKDNLKMMRKMDSELRKTQNRVKFLRVISVKAKGIKAN